MDAARYSIEAVVLVVLILGLLAFLFYLLMTWSHRVDQASYLGTVYRESVRDFEYKRLAAGPTEKLQKGEYEAEVQRDPEWLKTHPRPEPPAGLDLWEGGTRPPGMLGRIGRQRGGDPTNAVSSPAQLSDADRQMLNEYYRRRNEWEYQVATEANNRYLRDLNEARAVAETRSERAADVDLGVLRGRGGEFVLEFTTVVVIIFAAIVLGVLRILGTEQIGTLLAAIAGYVLGRATSRRPSPAEGAAETRHGASAVEETKTKQALISGEKVPA